MSNKSILSRAEQKFRATQKKEQEFLKQKDKEWQEKAEHRAKLKALRLARDEAEKEASESAAAK